MTTQVQRQVARAELLKRVLIVVTTVLVAVVLVLIVVTLNAVRATQQEGSPAVRRIETLSEQISSCTTPGGACYDRGVRNQKSAVGAITASQEDIAVVAAACADEPGTQSMVEIRRCVMQILAPIP